MYERTLIRTARGIKLKYHSISGASRFKKTLPFAKSKVLDCFELPVFNFAVDFELFWANAYMDGQDMTLEQRLQVAEKSSHSYRGLSSLLKDLNLQSTWAVVAKLVDPEAQPEEHLKFSPAWAKNDWYKIPAAPREFYDAKEFIRELKNDSLTEVISHGFGHIEFSDESVTSAIANADISLAKKILSDYVTTDKAFIYSSNKIEHEDILVSNGYSIIRGNDTEWKYDHKKNLVATPHGYWISPAMISLSQAKKLIDIGIKTKSFIHPWTHPRDINHKASDLEKFYRPLFEYVKRQERNGNLQILSFDEIWKIIEARLSS